MREKSCPYCLSTNVVKKGFNKRHTKRGYAYKSCSKRYVEGEKDYFIDQQTKGSTNG